MKEGKSDMHYITEYAKIYVYAMPVLDSRMYILINDQNEKEALIIDPLCSKDAIPIIRELTHVTVLLTHSHYDHISGVNWLRELTDCTVFCSKICAAKISNSHQNLAAFSTALIVGKTEEEQAKCIKFFEMDYACRADKTFEKETTFDFGSYHINIRYTPGHSDCSQCIELTSRKNRSAENSQKELPPEIIFTGDSLVNGHEVITRFPSGSRKQYIEFTKPYLDSLSEDALIMPGHGDWGRKKELI